LRRLSHGPSLFSDTKPNTDTPYPNIEFRRLKMADPMRIRAKVEGTVASVRVLMSHEMESGQRKDASGALVPAMHITDVTATLNGKVVMTAEWGSAVSKNPFLQFNVKGAKAGDKIAVTWKDIKGDTRTDEVTAS
jgi:sulfur-oxidizing protein SoxZ